MPALCEKYSRPVSPGVTTVFPDSGHLGFLLSPKTQIMSKTKTQIMSKTKTQIMSKTKTQIMSKTKTQITSKTKTQIMSKHKQCFMLKMPDCRLNLLLLPCGRSSRGGGWFSGRSPES